MDIMKTLATHGEYMIKSYMLIYVNLCRSLTNYQGYHPVWTVIALLAAHLHALNHHNKNTYCLTWRMVEGNLWLGKEMTQHLLILFLKGLKLVIYLVLRPEHDTLFRWVGFLLTVPLSFPFFSLCNHSFYPNKQLSMTNYVGRGGTRF